MVLLIPPKPTRHRSQAGLNCCDKSRRERARKGARASPWRNDRTLYTPLPAPRPEGRR